MLPMSVHKGRPEVARATSEWRNLIPSGHSLPSIDIFARRRSRGSACRRRNEAAAGWIGGLSQAQQDVDGECTHTLQPNAACEDCVREFGGRSA
jgi:hypothetical protein